MSERETQAWTSFWKPGTEVLASPDMGGRWVSCTVDRVHPGRLVLVPTSPDDEERIFSVYSPTWVTPPNNEPKKEGDLALAERMATEANGGVSSLDPTHHTNARPKVTETQVEDPKKPGEAAVAADFARIWSWGLEAELWTADTKQRFSALVIDLLAELIRRRHVQLNAARDRRAEFEVLMTHHNDDLRNLRLEHYEELRTLLSIVRKP